MPRLKGVETRKGLLRAFAELVDIYYRVFLASPVTRDVWSGMQADRALREIELADSRASAAALTAAMRRIAPSGDSQAQSATAFLIWQLGEATMRLAVSVDRDEGDQLVEAYKRMALRELDSAM